MNNFIISAISFVFTFIIIKGIIKIFEFSDLHQPIYDLAPENHLKKTKTATMGGVAFIFVVTVVSLFYIKVKSVNSIPIVSLLLFGFVGFIDDYIKVVRNNNMGLNAKQKLILQVVFAFIVAYLLKENSFTFIKLPFKIEYLQLDILFYPFVIVFFVAVTNSTNLTDGLDGLLSTNALIVSIFALYVSHRIGNTILFSLIIAFISAILAFLYFNKYPAKIFMGDTGSMAIGGFLAAIFLITATPLFMLVSGIIFVLESLSVIIQVVWYKYKKERIFLMSPLHHHYEKKGYSEKKVVFLFSLISFVALVINIILYNL